MDDVENYLVNNGPSHHGIPKYGLFLDPLSLLHWVYVKIMGRAMEQEEMLNKKKLGVHEHELRTLEAFGRDLPKVLDAPSTDLSTQNTSLALPIRIRKL